MQLLLLLLLKLYDYPGEGCNQENNYICKSLFYSSFRQPVHVEVYFQYGEKPLTGTAVAVKFFPGPAATVRAAKQPGVFLNGYSFNIAIGIFTATFILACYILATISGTTEFVDKLFGVRPIVIHRMPDRAIGCTLIGVIRRSILMATVVELE